MSKLHHPAEPVILTPWGQEDTPEAERLSYRLRVPTQWDAINLKRALVARRARQVGRATLVDAMREILAQVPSAAQGLAVLEAYAEQVEEFAVASREKRWGADEDGRRAQGDAWRALENAWDELKALTDICAELSDAFRSLLVDDATFWDICGLEATRMFVVGWDNGPAEFRRDDKGLPDDLLALVPEGHRTQIAVRVNELLRPSGQDAKNLRSPSRGAGTPATSQTARPQRRKNPATRAKAGT